MDTLARVAVAQSNTTGAPIRTPGVITLTGDDLTVDDVVRVARHNARVEIAPSAIERVRAARDVVDQALDRGDIVYGMNTGLGPLSHLRVSPENLERFLVRTVVGHAVAQRDLLDSEIVRAMMLVRANGIAKGGVGIRAEILRAIVAMLNAGVHPIVSRGGSVGQADLSEMAHIALVLIGLGEAEYQGRRLPGRDALAAAGLEPIQLKAKEALGLISANGLTIGQGALVLADIADLLFTFDISAALALEAFGANLSIIHPDAAKLKPHPGQRLAADRLRAVLEDSYLWSATGARNLQDPLSFRCIPQIHGACYDAYEHVRRIIEVELNAAGDNPLVSIDAGAIYSVGNFDVTSVAIAFDMLRIALAHVTQIANERVHKQLWTQFSGLPTGLGILDEPVGMLNPLARLCASLTAEATVLANHVSLGYRAQLAEGLEDHASMAPFSVQRTAESLRVAQRVAAMELMVSSRAIDLRGRPTLGRGTRLAYGLMRGGALIDTIEWEPNVERAVRIVSGGSMCRRVTRTLATVSQKNGQSGTLGPSMATRDRRAPVPDVSGGDAHTTLPRLGSRLDSTGSSMVAGDGGTATTAAVR